MTREDAPAVLAPPAPGASGARRERRWHAPARRALRSGAGLRLAHAVERGYVVGRLRAVERLRGGRPWARPPEVVRDGAVILLSAGGGNIGDQAMFEACLAHTPGPVVAVMRSAADFVVPPADRSRVRVLPAPLLSGGTLRGRRGEVRALAEALRRASSFAVIGADVMDGGYDRAESVTRAEVLRLSHRLGTPARVLGFSWGPGVDPVVAGALRRAARTAALFARDPVSAERLADAGIPAIASADLAFTVDDVREPADVAAGWGSLADPLVLINLSGLVERTVDLAGEFAELVDRLTEDGARVVLLPHCIRAGDDDLAVCRRVAAAVRHPERVHLVERILLPAEVRWLAARAEAVVTGRMHLSILALTQGTPIVVLRTRGKVEGLARLFALDEFVFDPAPGVGARIERMLSTARADALLRARIRERLPGVRALALGPFRGGAEDGAPAVSPR